MADSDKANLTKGQLKTLIHGIKNAGGGGEADYLAKEGEAGHIKNRPLYSYSWDYNLTNEEATFTLDGVTYETITDEGTDALTQELQEKLGLAGGGTYLYKIQKQSPEMKYLSENMQISGKCPNPDWVEEETTFTVATHAGTLGSEAKPVVYFDFPGYDIAIWTCVLVDDVIITITKNTAYTWGELTSSNFNASYTGDTKTLDAKYLPQATSSVKGIMTLTQAGEATKAGSHLKTTTVSGMPALDLADDGLADWSEQTPTNPSYVKNRTHYEIAAGSKIEEISCAGHMMVYSAESEIHGMYAYTGLSGPDADYITGTLYGFTDGVWPQVTAAISAGDEMVGTYVNGRVRYDCYGFRADRIKNGFKYDFDTWYVVRPDMEPETVQHRFKGVTFHKAAGTTNVYLSNKLTWSSSDIAYVDSGVEVSDYAQDIYLIALAHDNFPADSEGHLQNFDETSFQIFIAPALTAGESNGELNPGSNASVTVYQNDTPAVHKLDAKYLPDSLTQAIADLQSRVAALEGGGQ